MKLMRVSLAAVLAFGVGATVPAFAQHDHDGDSRHERDRDDDHGKGRGRHHEDRGRHEGRERREEARERREEHERQEAREHEWREHEWREHERERHEHYVWYMEHHRRHIPEDHFYARFGHEHPFVIVRPVIVAGRPRFQYGGYWFVIGRPLPAGWRYDEPMYVDFLDDGYYVCSPRHPGVHITVDIL